MNLKLRHHPTKRAPKKLADNNLFSKRNNNNYYSLQYQLSCFLKPAELPWWKNIPFCCHRKTQCQTWGLRLMQISQKAYFQCRPPLMHICVVAYWKSVFWVNGYEMSWNCWQYKHHLKSLCIPNNAEQAVFAYVNLLIQFETIIYFLLTTIL